MLNLFRIFILLMLPLFVDPGKSQAALSVGVGPEYFSWQESPFSGSGLRETGFRFAAKLQWEQQRSRGFLFGYEGKLYLGTVHYDGMTLGPNPVPVATDTTYTGLQNEGIFLFRQPLNDPFALDLMATAGWDHWNRNINPQNSNQLEDYDIIYLRMGPLLRHQIADKRFWFGIGGKFPVYTIENSHINTLCQNLSFTYSYFADCVGKNPPLHPGPQLSFYSNIGYQFNSLLSLTFYYDSFHFSKSQAETETGHGFYQPESFMDLIGVQAVYYFR